VHANQRDADRFELRLPITIFQPQPVSALTENVSARGVLLDAETELPEGAVTFVITFPPEITLSTPLQVRCDAQVVRVLERSKAHTRAAVRIRRYEFLNPNEQPRRVDNRGGRD
jgi:hypothetical protein